MKNVLIFDISNLLMRSLFAQTPSPTETKFDIFKLTFLNSFMKTIKDLKPDKVIAVEDAPDPWRKGISSLYKATRQAKREQSAVNFDAFFPVASEFINSLKTAFKNIQFIKVPHAEADDCIATIVKHHPEWEITTVSSDKDFIQLMQYPNFKLWDGIKHQYIESVNPEQELLLKIMVGDKSDNIPSVKRGVGPKKALKIINENLDEWLKEENLTERFQENMQLISFKCIPIEIEQAILTEFNNYEYQEYDEKAYFKWIQLSGLAELMLNFSEHSNIIRGLH